MQTAPRRTSRDGNNLPTQASISLCLMLYRGEMTPHLFILHSAAIGHYAPVLYKPVGWPCA